MGESIAASLSMVGNTAPFNASGHPATSVPIGFAHGMPVRMMIVGPSFQDHMCLRIAAGVERANQEASLQELPDGFQRFTVGARTCGALIVGGWRGIERPSCAPWVVHCLSPT